MFPNTIYATTVLFEVLKGHSGLGSQRIMKRFLVFIGFLLILSSVTGCQSDRSVSESRDGIRGLGYLTGADEMPGETGLRLRKRKPVRDLYVYSSGDTHLVRLMDDSGTIKHQWESEYSDAFNRRPRLEVFEDTDIVVTRGANPFPNGDLIIVYANVGMALLDRNSEVKWSKLNYAHHQTAVSGDSIYITRRVPRMLSIQHGDWPVMDEHVTIYSLKGQLRRSISIYDAFARSDFYGMIAHLDPTQWDLFHTNDIDLIPGDMSSVFNGGDVLLSFRKINSVVALDLAKREITWAMTGRTDRQHDPDILPNGNMLVFDNGVFRGQSRVLEFDPVTRKKTWFFTSEDFYTKCCGLQQRLANGNTFIVETYSGRAFEVTREGKIVWLWINPHSAYKREGKVGRLMMKRYPQSFFTFLDR